MNLSRLASWWMTTTVFCIVALMAALMMPPLMFASTQVSSSTLGTTEVGTADTLPQVVFSEDFSQDLSRWWSYRNGDKWNITNGRADGYVTSLLSRAELIPVDAAWNNDWKNYEFSFDMTPLLGSHRNALFGFQDPANWYELHFTSNEIWIDKLVNGAIPFHASAPITLTNGTTYGVTVRFVDGHITVLVNQAIILDTTDPTFDNDYGRIGLKVGTDNISSTRIQYDNVVVRWLPQPGQVVPSPTPTPTPSPSPLPTTQPSPIIPQPSPSLVPQPSPSPGLSLAVSSFKQTDPRWKNFVYDHAQKWSDTPTIERWGCLVSAIAMIMDYHHLSTLPDGTSVTPASLNAWLTAQPDGFLGEGLVNWAAVTRLTRQMNEKFGTPKLEYAAWVSNDLTTTISETRAGRPTILQIPGHFLVGRGFTPDESDVQILDPAYAYSVMSQHGNSLLSTRTLTPSHTDLSYLVIAHDPSLEVALTNEQGTSLPDEQVITESIIDQVDDSREASAPLTVHYLAKPSGGSYHLSVKQPTFGAYQVTIWAYDQQANLTNLSQMGQVGSLPHHFTVTYSPHQASTIVEDISLATFSQEIEELLNSGQILGTFAQTKLRVLSQLANQALTLAQRSSHKSPQTQQHLTMFRAVLEGLLKHAASSMTDSALSSLRRYLNLPARALSPDT